MSALRDLRPLLKPRSIAVVGATPDPNRIGGRPFAWLRRFGFPGPVHAVNPRHSEIDGAPCYARVRDIPAAPDMAVIAIPRRRRPRLVARLPGGGRARGDDLHQRLPRDRRDRTGSGSGTRGARRTRRHSRLRAELPGRDQPPRQGSGQFQFRAGGPRAALRAGRLRQPERAVHRDPRRRAQGARCRDRLCRKHRQRGGGRLLRRAGVHGAGSPDPRRRRLSGGGARRAQARRSRPRGAGARQACRIAQGGAERRKRRGGGLAHRRPGGRLRYLPRRARAVGRRRGRHHRRTARRRGSVRPVHGDGGGRPGGHPHQFGRSRGVRRRPAASAFAAPRAARRRDGRRHRGQIVRFRLAEETRWTSRSRR